MAGIITGVLIAIGIVMIIIGLIAFFIAYGLWTGQRWDWTLYLIFTIIGLIIDIIILYYLTRPHVKAFFGKEPPPEAPPLP